MFLFLEHLNQLVIFAACLTKSGCLYSLFSCTGRGKCTQKIVHVCVQKGYPKYWVRFFFYKDKTVVRSWYLHNGNLYTSNWNPHGKRTSLYLNLQGGRSPSKHTESCLKRYKKVACLCDGNRYAVKLVLVYRSGGSGGDNGASLSDEDNEPIARIIPGPPFTNMV